jgi:hypothetical protein
MRLTSGNPKTLTCLICLFISIQVAQTQDIIYLANPSFEGKPQLGNCDKTSGVPATDRECSTIVGWDDCGKLEFPEETPPDIFPFNKPIRGVVLPPKGGLTYLNVVTRQNGSRESVSQTLPSPLESGQCYRISLDAALSPVQNAYYQGKTFNASYPIHLRIWGGKSSCDKSVLLATSRLISNTDWKTYTFEFNCKTPLSSISLEAYYPEWNVVSTHVIEKGWGHVLIDAIQPIIRIACQ